MCKYRSRTSTNHRRQIATKRTNIPGIFAPGDIRSGSARQWISAAGDGATAAIAAQAAAAMGLITRGLVIILFLIFEPRGLDHRWGMVKAYFRLWPFSHEE
jgi:hypothetical protein